eukprot:m.138969 g.138969  ORF g.138969 m.138969 type:complete len:428 (-) comp14014_c0_seq12:2926-4209(-)
MQLDLHLGSKFSSAFFIFSNALQRLYQKKRIDIIKNVVYGQIFFPACRIRRWWICRMTCLMFPYEALLLLKDTFTVVSALRVVRMVQFVSVPTILQSIELRSSSSSLGVWVAYYGTLVILVVHSVSCTWLLFACPMNGRNVSECDVSSWYSTTPQFLAQDLKQTGWSMYTDSVYWSVATMTTTGYGEIHPVNRRERLASQVVMLVGKLLFGFIVGNIMSTLANSDFLKERFREQLSSLLHAVNARHVPRTLKNLLIQYHEKVWTVDNSIQVASVIRELPMTLRAEIGLGMCRNILLKEPFFQNANPDLVTLVSVTFEPVFFPSGCPVSHIGDRGDQLFLVHQGLVEEQSAQGVTINSFESGDIVGFIEMVRDAQKQTRFVAVADSHLLVIDRLKFIHLLERFPESLAAFQEQVRHSRRQQGDREAVV